MIGRLAAQRFYDHVRIVVFFELSTAIVESFGDAALRDRGREIVSMDKPYQFVALTLSLHWMARHAPVIGNYSGSPALRRPSTSRAA
jgi:hypothetical protein